MTEKEIKWVPGEVLDDDYPVFGDYLYFADDRLIRSDIFGTVRDLKRDLRSQDITFEYIRAARMDFAEKDE